MVQPGQQRTRPVDRVSFIVAAISTLVGGATGWAIQEIVDDVGDLRLWLFLATSMLTLCLVVGGTSLLRGFSKLWRQSEQSMMGIAAHMGDIVTSSIPHQARLIPRATIYPEMARRIREARFEVAVITYFMYDWDNDNRTFMTPATIPENRQEFYSAVEEAILRPEIEYTRVWQVPPERKAEALTKIRLDPNHASEIDLIANISKDRPDQARLIIADQQTTASFIMVDRKHLFVNIDFYEPSEHIWYSPYMLCITDSTALAFNELKSVIVRLTSIRS